MTDYWNKKTLVLGCGNILFGDDGFGPEAVEYFKTHYEIPENTYVENVGISVREILFNVALAEKRPEHIFIVDAVDRGRLPGEVFQMEIDDLPENKTDDFSMHTIPSSNLLRDLEETGIDVAIIVCQVGCIPESVAPGLSEPVRQAIPVACDLLQAELKKLEDANA